ncbi:3,4-dihydroxy-2-butanone 4-phosphate synthase [uncultured archaeon]|nr:3,4-dihydroxy-2-butanone 4-phosphate synthase [uncultured archaeon]
MKETLKKATDILQKGGTILIHDNKDRENEIDLVTAAAHTTPATINQLRQDAGGLICATIPQNIAEKIGLSFTEDLNRELAARQPLLAAAAYDHLAYDSKSSFSITINSRTTRTGITDTDRSRTLQDLAELIAKKPTTKTFGNTFRTPGHIHLLISRGLKNRQGHTELADAVIQHTNLPPIAVICEMLDSKTHKALSPKKAQEYAKKNKTVLLSAEDILQAEGN